MRTLFRFIVAITLVPCVAPAVAAEGPNIVFILADDLGITDIAAYGSHFSGTAIEDLYYETPHMDQLVKQGVAFAQYYANQLCSPTRAALMTGQYAARLGFTTATPRTQTYYNQGINPPDGYDPHDVLMHKDKIQQQQAWINGRSNTALDPSLTTLPKVLKSHRSAFIGKWHLGGHGAEGFQPLDHGFDEAPAWSDAGGSVYFNRGNSSWVKHWNEKELPFPNMPQHQFKVGDAGSEPQADYLTDDLTHRAVSFIHRAVDDQETGTDKRPFFLYLNHFAVHTPLQAPQRSIAHFENKPQRGAIGHDNSTYAAMIKHLDDSVGRIVQALKKSGRMNDTIVVLTSDNGGVEYTSPAATDNFPFKGGKACLHEGGVRVPMIYWQPGKFEGGNWCDTPTHCIDQLPTLAALTGNPVPEDVDGINLVPLLENPAKETTSRTFYWHYPFNVIVKHPDNGLPLTPHSGIRDGDYKLLWDWHGKLELFDISVDPYEAHDLAESMPQKRDELFDKLHTWIRDNVEERYLPIRNPDYQPAKDNRPYSFVDLSAGVLGEKLQSQTKVTHIDNQKVKTSDRVQPPTGRLAIVADGNSPDPDDIGATAVMFGLLKASELGDRLVHLSHSCDLIPAKKISAKDELRRQKVLHQVCSDGISKFAPFENLPKHFNCRTDQEAAVNNLREAINASSKNNPLWIVEAGEPDVIGYALAAAKPAKRKHVHVISHHPANDNAGDFFEWKQILEFGVNEHQIGDQNVGLQTSIDLWDWAKEHDSDGVAWIWKQLQYAEQDGVVKFQTNKFDCSDAGMVYWWITGADRGGNKNATPEDIKSMLGF